MKNTKDILTKGQVLRFITALLMCTCLVFLTGINFFVYSAGKQVCMIDQADGDEPEEKAPEKPVEEKSSSVNNSIQEEYVHELHLLQGFALSGKTLKYCLLDEAKLSIVHFDLISPPPDL